MSNLGDLAFVLGSGLLGGSGPSGRQAASGILQQKLQTQRDAQRIRMQDQWKQQQLGQDRAKLMAQTLIKGIQEGGVSEQDLPQSRILLATILEKGLGVPAQDAEGVANSIGPLPASGGTSTVSQPGTVSIGGVRRPVALDNKGGVLFTDTREPVPAEAFSSYIPLKPPTPAVGSINIDMSPKTKSDLEGKAIQTSDAASRLNNIRQSFNSEYLTWGGKLKGLGLDTFEQLGGELSPKQKKFVTGITKFQVRALGNLNDYIHEVTGAQMSIYEAERIRKAVADPEKMGPTKFKAAMDATLQDLALMNARAKIMRQRNISWDFNAPENRNREGPITLEQTREIINQRGKELTASFIAQGDDEATARNKAWQQTSIEFGLTP